MTDRELQDLIKLIEETIEPCDTVKGIEEALTSKGLSVHDWNSAYENPPLNADTNGTGRVLAIGRNGYVHVWHWEMVALAYDKFYCWMPLPIPLRED